MTPHASVRSLALPALLAPVLAALFAAPTPAPLPSPLPSPQLVPASPQQAAGPDFPRAWTDEPPGQLIFFAVLEGLYTDGVQPEAVRAVLQGPGDPPDTDAAAEDAATADADPSAAWKRHLETTLFVPACPLCTPVQVAFELYAARGPLHLKAHHPDGRPLDTFGPGLPDEVVARLASPDRGERLAALEPLVEAWVARRLDLMRATPAEREALGHWMEDGRKRGMVQLGALRRDLDTEAASSWPSCASCDASVEACAPR